VRPDDLAYGRDARIFGHRIPSADRNFVTAGRKAMHIRASALAINKKGHRRSGAPEPMLDVCYD
jgi:hypothetical protein